MICPHGNEAESAPWDDCARCEAVAGQRPQHLAELEHVAALAAGAIDLRPEPVRLDQPELPSELIPRAAGTLL